MQVNTNRHSYKHIDATRVRLIPINIYKNTTYRQTLTPTGKQTDTHTQVQTHRHKGKHAETIVDTQAQIKHTNTMKDIKTTRQKNTDTQLNEHRQTDTITNTQTQLHTYMYIPNYRHREPTMNTLKHLHTGIHSSRHIKTTKGI